MSQPTVVVIEPQDTPEPEATPIAVVETPSDESQYGQCCEHCVQFAAEIQSLRDAAVITAEAVEEVSETAEHAEVIAEVAAETASEAISEVIEAEAEHEEVIEEQPAPAPEIEPKSKIHPFYRKRQRMEG